MFRKLLSLIIVLMVAALVYIPVFAEDMDSPVDEPIIQEYQYISTINTSLNISGGKASASVTVDDLNNNTTKIYATMTLQKKSGGSWSNIEKWDKTTYSRTLTLSKTKAISKGTYRLKCVIKAYKNANCETITKYSLERKY